MSELAIFIIGAVVFAVTVAGVVMAGGFAMRQAEVQQNPFIEDRDRRD
jgi:hypothetical protein